MCLVHDIALSDLKLALEMVSTNTDTGADAGTDTGTDKNANAEADVGTDKGAGEEGNTEEVEELGNLTRCESK